MTDHIWQYNQWRKPYSAKKFPNLWSKFIFLIPSMCSICCNFIKFTLLKLRISLLSNVIEIHRKQISKRSTENMFYKVVATKLRSFGKKKSNGKIPASILGTHNSSMPHFHSALIVFFVVIYYKNFYLLFFFAWEWNEQ